jgi:hypothetical protein
MDTLDAEFQKILTKLEQYYIDVRSFKQFFIRNCKVERKYEAYKVWAHWLIRNLCEVSDNYHIIPDHKIAGDTDIITHLKEKGSDEDEVHQFYNKVVQQAHKLFETYNQFKIDLYQDEELIKKISKYIEYSEMTENDNNHHMYRFLSAYTKHNDIKHTKLMSQYKGDPECRNFYFFDVGFNYYILDGHSLQWCIPPKVFEILYNRLSVKTELFASPTNAALPLYCSLFVVDKKFGALENFFNLDLGQIMEGAYEVNPPFIEKIFIRSSKMIINFLENSEKQGKELMYIYIMPDWLDSQGYQILVTSPYLVDEIIFKQNKHFYYQSSNNRMVMANFESHVLVVGTSQAKKRWTSKIKKELIQNFSYYDKKNFS